MRLHIQALYSIAAPICLTLAGCGGGGSGISSVPSPIAPQAPAPPTSAGLGAALVAPAQSSSPGVVEALQGGPSIRDASLANIRLPVTQTAVAANFSGDAAETSRPKEFFPNLIGDGPFASNAGGGWSLGVTTASPDLDWTAYGYWDPFRFSALPQQSRGAWLAGLQTPLAAIPLSGTARSSGKVLGLASEYFLCQCNSVAEVTGNVALSADFNAHKLSGTMTGLSVRSTGNPSGPLNNISFSATIAAGRNLFAGTTVVSSVVEGPWALASNATGDLTGHFYGPSAEELGAVWTLFDATRRVIGSFGAGREKP